MQSLVASAFVVRSSDALSRHQLAAALSAITRVRACLDGLEAAAAQLLAKVCSFPEALVAEATRTELGEAARRVERADTLVNAPEFAAALADGHVSGSHVDVLTRALRRLEPSMRSCLVERAGVLADVAKRSTVDAFARSMQDEVARLTSVADAEARLAQQKRATAMKTWTDKVSGMWCGRFELDPVAGLRVHGRLEAMMTELFADKVPDTCPSDPGAKQDHLRALALIAFTERGPGSFDEPSTPRSGGTSGHVPSREDGGTAAASISEHAATPVRAPAVSRTEVVLVVDLDRNGQPTIDYGLPVEIPVTSIVELCRNAVIMPVVVRDGVVVGTVGRLDLGRTSRLANAAQRRALRAMHPTCAIPGCRVRYAYTKPHHVIWWRQGGLTDLANLLPLCSKHHHAVHDQGWQLKLLPNRTLIVTLPDGTVLETGPPSTPNLPSAAVRRRPVGRAYSATGAMDGGSGGSPLPAAAFASSVRTMRTPPLRSTAEPPANRLRR